MKLNKTCSLLGHHTVHSYLSRFLLNKENPRIEWMHLILNSRDADIQNRQTHTTTYGPHHEKACILHIRENKCAD